MRLAIVQEATVLGSRADIVDAHEVAVMVETWTVDNGERESRVCV
jgi:hypothetical protein